MAARHKRKAGRGWKIVLVALGVIALLGGGTAYAAYRYDRSASDRVLPGIRIAGIDVGGMTRDEAVRLVREQADARLTGDLAVQAAGSIWTVSPAALGTTADVESIVDEALGLADGMSFVSRVYHRLADEPVDRAYELAFDYDEDAVATFVQQASEEVTRPAIDARIELLDGELVTERSQEGLTVKTALATKRILNALAHELDGVEIPVRSVEPEVSTASLGTSIVVDVSANRLWLYDGLSIVKTYRVATGTPQYPTPVGTFEIVDKKENPTWYNPAPDTWGADLPASIGPGPGNPLGTRAMYLNAPGIRIHGTWDSSSIGTAASHGCIRMHVEDSEQLYPLVPIGTRVIVKP